MTNKYLNMLVDDIHSTIVSPVSTTGMPESRIIDMMLVEDNKIYFLTARKKLSTTNC